MEMKRLNAPWPAGLIADARMNEKNIPALKHHNIVSLHQPYTLFDKNYIAWVHAQGLRALAFTVKKSEEAAALKRDGIDGVFVDDMVLLS